MTVMRRHAMPDLPPDLIVIRSLQGGWWVESYREDRFLEAVRFRSEQAALDWAMDQAPVGGGFRAPRPGRRDGCFDA